MKIACFADLHLTDNFNTVKLPVLRWALAEAKARNVDCLALLGDLTATGTVVQTEKVLSEIAAGGLPFCSTCGNAEYRTDESGKTAAAFDLKPESDCGIFMMDSAFSTPKESDLAALAALPDNAGKLLLTHVPPAQWLAEAQEILAKAQQRRAVTFILAGHTHLDSDVTLRGLDPDKAAGNPPGFEIITGSDDGSWQRECVTMPMVDPVQWSEEEKAHLRGLFGISAMYEHETAVKEAIRLNIPHLELRYDPGFPAMLPELISQWRRNGGKTLSMHLTNLNADACPHLADSVAAALAFKCDRVTLHVPQVTAADFAEKREKLLENFDRFLKVLLDNGIAIGIENLHTRDGERSFETRNFGCNISECRLWIDTLREKYQTDKVGFHLDIGHARNNAPLSATENLSDYYCEMGQLINGWHFHQVEQQAGGKFKNHRELTGFFTKLISLGGFLLAHRAGQLADAPIFMEVTTPGGSINSYKTFMEVLK